MDDTIRTACKLHPKRSVENILGAIVPKSLAKQLCALTEINGETHGGEINNKQFAALAQIFQNLPITAIGRGAGDEFVTAGGVELSEVDPSTMQSKITPGLFFGGEILNIDGFTGGFNLQASWATGRLAGLSILK
jgi:predicted flavoprotein YhiN